MSDIKQILVVDDHFGTLELLREMLNTGKSRYEVVTVRSGEEAGLELRRPYDLLITDLKLPGMHGIEVVKRARTRHPDMPVIVISGFPLELARDDVQGLDAVAFFRKPLEADEVLAAVHLAIYGEPLAPEVPEAPAGEDIAIVEEVEIIETDVSSNVVDRINRLRIDTGADELILGTIDGNIAVEAGSAGGINLFQLGQTIARNLRGSFVMGDQLEADEPQMIQYQKGTRYDVYTANVGRYYFVTMFFDAQARRARIGAVWVFVQRAIKDLLPLLPADPVKGVTEQPLPVHPAPAKESVVVADTPAVVEPVIKKIPKPEPEPEPAAPAYYAPPPSVELEPLSDEDMEKLATLEIGDEDPNADVFWDELLTETPDAPDFDVNVSFEEALRQGILPSEATQLFKGSDEPSETAAPPPAEAEETPDTAVDDADVETLVELGDADAATDAEVNAFWNAIVSGDTEKPASSEGLSFEEALQRGLLEEETAEEAGWSAGEEETTPQEGLDDLAELDLGDADADVDSFWDNAIAEEADTAEEKGISWEDALKRGLIPNELNQNDEQ